MKITKNVVRAALAAILAAALAQAAPAQAQSADLSIAYRTPAAAVAHGATTTFTARITNFGPDTATAVAVTATAPAGASVTAVGGCTPFNATAVPPVFFPCTITAPTGGTAGALAGTNAIKDVTVSVKYALPDPLPTVCPNAFGAVSVSVASAVTDPVPANNSASVTPATLALTDLEVAVTGPASVPHGGGTFTFDYTVTNHGPCALPDAWLTVDDSVTTGFTWVSATGPCAGIDPMTDNTIDGDFNADGSDYQYCPVGPLLSGGSISGTKTYHLASLASDLISSNQGTGLLIQTRKFTFGGALNPLDFNDPVADNNSSDVTYVVTKSFGCSSAGGGTAFGLVALGLAALFLKRRRVA